MHKRYKKISNSKICLADPHSVVKKEECLNDITTKYHEVCNSHNESNYMEKLGLIKGKKYKLVHKYRCKEKLQAKEMKRDQSAEKTEKENTAYKDETNGKRKQNEKFDLQYIPLKHHKPQENYMTDNNVKKIYQDSKTDIYFISQAENYRKKIKEMKYKVKELEERQATEHKHQKSRASRHKKERYSEGVTGISQPLNADELPCREEKVHHWISKNKKHLNPGEYAEKKLLDVPHKHQRKKVYSMEKIRNRVNHKPHRSKNAIHHLAADNQSEKIVKKRLEERIDSKNEYIHNNVNVEKQKHLKQPEQIFQALNTAKHEKHTPSLFHNVHMQYGKHIVESKNNSPDNSVAKESIATSFLEHWNRLLKKSKKPKGDERLKDKIETKKCACCLESAPETCKIHKRIKRMSENVIDDLIIDKHDKQQNNCSDNQGLHHTITKDSNCLTDINTVFSYRDNNNQSRSHSSRRTYQVKKLPSSTINTEQKSSVFPEFSEYQSSILPELLKRRKKSPNTTPDEIHQVQLLKLISTKQKKSRVRRHLLRKEKLKLLSRTSYTCLFEYPPSDVANYNADLQNDILKLSKRSKPRLVYSLNTLNIASENQVQSQTERTDNQISNLNVCGDNHQDYGDRELSHGHNMDETCYQIQSSKNSTILPSRFSVAAQTTTSLFDITILDINSKEILYEKSAGKKGKHSENKSQISSTNSIPKSTLKESNKSVNFNRKPAIKKGHSRLKMHNIQPLSSLDPRSDNEKVIDLIQSNNDERSPFVKAMFQIVDILPGRLSDTNNDHIDETKPSKKVTFPKEASVADKKPATLEHDEPIEKKKRTPSFKKYYYTNHDMEPVESPRSFYALSDYHNACLDEYMTESDKGSYSSGPNKIQCQISNATESKIPKMSHMRNHPRREIRSSSDSSRASSPVVYKELQRRKRIPKSKSSLPEKRPEFTNRASSPIKSHLYLNKITEEKLADLDTISKSTNINEGEEEATCKDVTNNETEINSNLRNKTSSKGVNVNMEDLLVQQNPPEVIVLKSKCRLRSPHKCNSNSSTIKTDSELLITDGSSKTSWNYIKKPTENEDPSNSAIVHLDVGTKFTGRYRDSNDESSDRQQSEQAHLKYMHRNQLNNDFQSNESVWKTSNGHISRRLSYNQRKRHAGHDSDVKFDPQASEVVSGEIQYENIEPSIDVAIRVSDKTYDLGSIQSVNRRERMTSLLPVIDRNHPRFKNKPKVESYKQCKGGERMKSPMRLENNSETTKGNSLELGQFEATTLENLRSPNNQSTLSLSTLEKEKKDVGHVCSKSETNLTDDRGNKNNSEVKLSSLIILENFTKTKSLIPRFNKAQSRQSGSRNRDRSRSAHSDKNTSSLFLTKDFKGSSSISSYHKRMLYDKNVRQNNLRKNVFSEGKRRNLLPQQVFEVRYMTIDNDWRFINQISPNEEAHNCQISPPYSTVDGNKGVNIFDMSKNSSQLMSSIMLVNDFIQSVGNKRRKRRRVKKCSRRYRASPMKPALKKWREKSFDDFFHMISEQLGSVSNNYSKHSENCPMRKVSELFFSPADASSVHSFFREDKKFKDALKIISASISDYSVHTKLPYPSHSESQTKKKVKFNVRNKLCREFKAFLDFLFNMLCCCCYMCDKKEGTHKKQKNRQRKSYAVSPIENKNNPMILNYLNVCNSSENVLLADKNVIKIIYNNKNSLIAPIEKPMTHQTNKGVELLTKSPPQSIGFCFDKCYTNSERQQKFFREESKENISRVMVKRRSKTTIIATSGSESQLYISACNKDDDNLTLQKKSKSETLLSNVGDCDLSHSSTSSQSDFKMKPEKSHLVELNSSNSSLKSVSQYLTIDKKWENVSCSRIEDDMSEESGYISVKSQKTPSAINFFKRKSIMDLLKFPAENMDNTVLAVHTVTLDHQKDNGVRSSVKFDCGDCQDIQSSTFLNTPSCITIFENTTSNSQDFRIATKGNHSSDCNSNKSEDFMLGKRIDSKLSQKTDSEYFLSVLDSADSPNGLEYLNSDVKFIFNNNKLLNSESVVMKTISTVASRSLTNIEDLNINVKPSKIGNILVSKSEGCLFAKKLKCDCIKNRKYFNGSEKLTEKEIFERLLIRYNKENEIAEKLYDNDDIFMLERTSQNGTKKNTKHGIRNIFKRTLCKVKKVSSVPLLGLSKATSVRPQFPHLIHSEGSFGNKNEEAAPQKVKSSGIDSSSTDHIIQLVHKVKSHFSSLVEAGKSNKSLFNEKFNGFLNYLEEIEKVDVPLINCNARNEITSNILEDRVRAKIKQSYAQAYRIAESIFAGKKSKMTPLQMDLIKLFVTKYGVGVLSYAATVGMFIGRGLISSEEHLGATVKYLQIINKKTISEEDLADYLKL